jgi:hypothetical protein
MGRDRGIKKIRRYKGKMMKKNKWKRGIIN